MTRIDRHRGLSLSEPEPQTISPRRLRGAAAAPRSDKGLIPSEMAVRVIGSWYYTSELPRQEAANLRAAMIRKDCKSLETWLKTSVRDADRKTRLYALLRHAAFESWLAGLELLIKYDADVNPPAGGGRRDGALDGADGGGAGATAPPVPVRKIAPGRPHRRRVVGTIHRATLRAGRSAGALRGRTAPGALGRRSGQRTVPPKPLRSRSAKRIVPKGLVVLGSGLGLMLYTLLIS